MQVNLKYGSVSQEVFVRVWLCSIYIIEAVQHLAVCWRDSEISAIVYFLSKGDSHIDV